MKPYAPSPMGPSRVSRFIRDTVKHALWQVHYHEQALIEAHENLGLAKAFVLREGADVGFTFEELRAEIEKDEEDHGE